MATATASGGDGSARAGERERERAAEEGRPRERVREVRGGAWHRAGHPGRRGSEAGRQEVAGRVRARRGHMPLSSWREVEDDWHWPVGWAGLLGHWAARLHVSTGKYFPFVFLFYLCNSFSDLVKY